MSINIDSALADFRQTLPFAGLDAKSIQFELIDRGCPHVPPALPSGKMAVYIFALADRVLKVGKVGPNSRPRFRTQHYVPGSSPSNLAKSLLADETSDCRSISEDEIGSWMQQKLHRMDILLDSNVGVAVLAYLEAFLHCRLRPVYEGFKSQKA